MACAHPFLFNPYSHDKSKIYRIKNFNQMYFPCGWCLNCRVDKINELQHRCEYEYIKRMCGAFVTFTYDDLHIHKLMHYDTIDKKLVASLSKKDAKHFLDRLNKLVHSKPDSPFCNHDYKYLIVGEYGENGQMFDRPHFHCLFFGLDFDLCKDLFLKAWQQQGSIYVGNIGDGAIGYCLKYLDKQLHGDLLKLKYDCHNIEPPFQHHSLGLGSDLYSSQQDYIRSHNFNYHWHGHDTPVPIYFRNKFYRNPVSPDYARHQNQKKLIEKFIQEHNRKPKTSFDLHDFSLENAKRRERCLKIKEHQHGKPVLDLIPMRTYNLFEQINYSSSDFGIHRLNIPPMDINALVNEAYKFTHCKVRSKSWQRRAIEACSSTDEIPF